MSDTRHRPQKDTRTRQQKIEDLYASNTSCEGERRNAAELLKKSGINIPTQKPKKSLFDTSERDEKAAIMRREQAQSAAVYHQRKTAEKMQREMHRKIKEDMARQHMDNYADTPYSRSYREEYSAQPHEGGGNLIGFLILILIIIIAYATTTTTP